MPEDDIKRPTAGQETNRPPPPVWMTRLHSTKGWRAVVGFTVLWAIALAWFYGSTTQDKVLGLVLGSVYGGIEYTWTACSTLSPDGGRAHFTPFSRTRPGHTTWSQWLCNVLYLPLALPPYLAAMGHPATMALCFPLFIWALEAAEGYVLQLLVGYNPAWFYCGSGAALHGNIQLHYAPQWWLLGCGLALVVTACPGG